MIKYLAIAIKCKAFVAITILVRINIRETTHLSSFTYNPDIMPSVVVKATRSGTHGEPVVVTYTLTIIRHQL